MRTGREGGMDGKRESRKSMQSAHLDDDDDDDDGGGGGGGGGKS